MYHILSIYEIFLKYINNQLTNTNIIYKLYWNLIISNKISIQS